MGPEISGWKVPPVIKRIQWMMEDGILTDVQSKWKFSQESTPEYSIRRYEGIVYFFFFLSRNRVKCGFSDFLFERYSCAQWF